MNVYLPTILCRFLLVALNIDAILGEVTIRQRKKKLEEMTQGKGLSDAYAATLSRLKAQKGYKSILGLKVLMWVLYSERPLRAEELCHALGVEIGSADLDPENIPALRALLSSCLGLVTVEASSSTIRLVHFTLQEHLSSDPTLFASPHSEIAEVCLTYLNFRSVQDLTPTLTSVPSTMPFLRYASLYWGMHTRQGMAENIKILALRLLDRFDEHISAQLLLRHGPDTSSDPRFNKAEGPKGFTGLHGVTFLGIVEIAAAVMDMKEWGVNEADCTGNTALTWAAIRGHDGVVKKILEREGVNPNQADTKYGRTPLWWAVCQGHEGVVKALLKRGDVNLNQADTVSNRTPLSWAAEMGHERVVKMLLEREDINPDQADTISGRTPLSWAAEKGHEWLVNMLLEQEDVNPGKADNQFGRTPLSWAAWGGHEGIVKNLLKRKDVRTTAPDNASQTPLSLARFKGHGEVTKIAKGRDTANSVATHSGSQASLPLSIGHEDERVVQMQSTGDYPNAGSTDLNSRPALLPPGDTDKRGEESHLQHSVSQSADNEFSTELPQPPSMRLSKPWHPPRKTRTHSTNPQSILLFAVDHFFIISSLISLFAFLLYILLFSPLT